MTHKAGQILPEDPSQGADAAGSSWSAHTVLHMCRHPKVEQGRVESRAQVPTATEDSMSPTHKDVTFNFRWSSTLREQCEEVADRAGLTLSDWIRAVLARAANEGAFAPRKRRTRHGTKKLTSRSSATS
jgi:hypothetical protein